MKGIVFNLLQETVERGHGEDAWDEVLEEAGVDGAFTSLGSYSDETLMRLIQAAARRLNTDPRSLTRWFGETAFPLLAAKTPGLVSRYGDVRGFLLALNDIIHPEVRKIYPGAETPEFDFGESTESELVMAYSSRRRLCAFAEGLIFGAAHHFREQVQVEHALCTHRGDSKCVFRIRSR